MAKFEIDSVKLTNISKAAYAGERSFAEEVKALKAVAVDGTIPKPYADAYKTAVVCSRLGLTRTKANLAFAAQPEHKEFRAMAANRLSRRVKAAGIKAANKSGRKRGTRVTTGTPAQHAPQPQTIVGRTIIKGGKKVQREAAAQTFRGMSVPTLASVAEMDDFISGITAFVRATATANPSACDEHTQAALMALTAAAETLRRTRVENEGDDEPNH